MLKHLRKWSSVSPKLKIVFEEDEHAEWSPYCVLCFEAPEINLALILEKNNYRKRKYDLQKIVMDVSGHDNLAAA